MRDYALPNKAFKPFDPPPGYREIWVREAGRQKELDVQSQLLVCLCPSSFLGLPFHVVALWKKWRHTLTSLVGQGPQLAIAMYEVRKKIYINGKSEDYRVGDTT